MKITTNAASLAGSIKLMATLPQKAADAQAKSFTNRETGVIETKTTDDGRPLYRVDFNVLALDENGVPARQERDVFLSLIKPVDILPGIYYILAGEVTVTHYVTATGRLGVSLIAETVVPEKQASNNNNNG